MNVKTQNYKFNKTHNLKFVDLNNNTNHWYKSKWIKYLTHNILKNTWCCCIINRVLGSNPCILGSICANLIAACAKAGRTIVDTAIRGRIPGGNGWRNVLSVEVVGVGVDSPSCCSVGGQTRCWPLTGTDSSSFLNCCFWRRSLSCRWISCESARVGVVKLWNYI